MLQLGMTVLQCYNSLELNSSCQRFDAIQLNDKNLLLLDDIHYTRISKYNFPFIFSMRLNIKSPDFFWEK